MKIFKYEVYRSSSKTSPLMLNWKHKQQNFQCSLIVSSDGRDFFYLPSSNFERSQYTRMIYPKAQPSGIFIHLDTWDIWVRDEKESLVDPGKYVFFEHNSRATWLILLIFEFMIIFQDIFKIVSDLLEADRFLFFFIFGIFNHQWISYYTVRILSVFCAYKQRAYFSKFTSTHN